jgi:hypothetical protein
LYYTLRVDSDPTSWELWEGVEEVLTSSDPEVLTVSHPLWGELVLSPQSVGSAVFLEYQLPKRYGTRPDGCPIPPGGALYLPSPIGPDILMNPPNIYTLDSSMELGVLRADLIAAMTDGTFLTVKVAQGEVVINGAKVPFAVLCPPNPGH